MCLLEGEVDKSPRTNHVEAQISQHFQLGQFQINPGKWLNNLTSFHYQNS